MTDYAVYIHIPFCARKCGYCDFTSYAGGEALFEPYVDALIGELKLCRPILERGQARSVYLGGGTPSVLPTPLLGRLIMAVRALVPLAPTAEFTIEVNPGATSLEQLTAMYELGVNRVSLGMQAFNNEVLRRLGRIHTVRDNRDAVRWARAAGIVNVSFDLMYGVPGQTMAILREDLDYATDLAPTHLSVYGLTIEEGTAFAHERDAGTLDLPGEELAAEMYDYLTETIADYGFERYEIANFARPGFESRHNLAYWTDVPYEGFGVAAHSYDGCLRTTHGGDVAGYIKAIAAGRRGLVPTELPTRERFMSEFCFTALRTARGLSRQRFAGKFRVDLESVYGAALDKLMVDGLLARGGDRYRLTKRGMKFGNVAFREFVINDKE